MKLILFPLLLHAVCIALVAPAAAAGREFVPAAALGGAAPAPPAFRLPALDSTAPAASSDGLLLLLLQFRGGETASSTWKKNAAGVNGRRAARQVKGRSVATGAVTNKKGNTKPAAGTKGRRRTRAAPPPPQPAAAGNNKSKKAATWSKKARPAAKTAAATSAAAAANTASGSSAVGLLSDGSNQMPTLFFAPDEADLDRYAACLAAAEGLRRARDASIKSSKVRRALKSIDEGKMDATLSKNKDRMKLTKKWSTDERKEYDTLRATYAVNTAKMVKSLGLSVARFNQLGKIVGSDPVLKERVMEQAYLYGMAAGLTGMERVPLIRGDVRNKQRVGPNTASGGSSGKSAGGGRGAGAASALGDSSAQIETFARCLSEVETLRQSNMERLRQSLGVDYLPPVICDPNVRSLLDPRVRAVCDAFPLQAEEVVAKFGMGSDEFNGLLDRLRSDPIFRWRVKRCMSKV